MKHFLARDKRRRLLFSKFEFDRLFLKSVYYNGNLNSAVRERARRLLMNIPKDSSLTRLHNRCTITNRSRGILTFFKVSRMVFRDLASRGLLYGVRKSGKQ